MTSFVAENARRPGHTHVVLITTGSVASIKAPLIVKELLSVSNDLVSFISSSSPGVDSSTRVLPFSFDFPCRLVCQRPGGSSRDQSLARILQERRCGESWCKGVDRRRRVDCKDRLHQAVDYYGSRQLTSFFSCRESSESETRFCT